MIRENRVTLSVTQAEAHLIMRLRMVKNKEHTGLFLLTINPLTISMVGQIELLEKNVATSGSGVPG